MRYIDADKIQYTMLYKENWITNTGVEKQGAWKEDIDKIPTADVRENVRGEWHDGDCSCCGWSWRDIACDSDLHNGLQSNFCPNCGADMMIGEENV